MAFGLQVRDSAGGVTFDSNSFSVRLIYQTTVSANGTYAIPGFDSSKGVAWTQYASGASVGWVGKYVVNQNSITVQDASASIPVTIYAVMFS